MTGRSIDFLKVLSLLSCVGFGLSACTHSQAPNLAPPVTATDAFKSERITVSITGSGPDVILIPGLGSSPAAWASTVAALPGYRYHLVQINGFAGKSAGANATGPVLRPTADEISRYIAQQRLVSPALVGHSLGGSLAMQVAIANPTTTSKVMVVDMLPFLGAMFGPPGTNVASVEPTARIVRTGIASSVGDVRTSQTATAINGMIRTEAMRGGALADSLASDATVSGQAMYDLITTDLTSDMARLTMPLSVLYVTPTGSPLSDTQMDFFYKSAYAKAPNHTLIRVPDSAHFIMWDQPALFVQTLKAFLEK